MPISKGRAPPRILLITARADHGGGPRHILDLLKSFRAPHFVFFIAAPNQEPYFPQFKNLSHGTLEIPPRSFSVLTLFKLLRFVRLHEVNVVHSHGRGAGLYSRILALLFYFQQRPTRVLHTFHGIHREKSFKGRLKTCLDCLLAFAPALS